MADHDATPAAGVDPPRKRRDRRDPTSETASETAAAATPRPDIALIRGRRVVLRGPERRDIETFRRLGVDPEIERLFGSSAVRRRELTSAEAHALYDEMVADPNAHQWVIEVHGAAIGTARLHSLNPEERRASYAIGILSAEHLGRGLGTEATRLILGYAFDVLRLHRVAARVLDFNERAIASYAKCGFVIEGRERGSAVVDGVPRDDLLMGLLEDEYRGLAPSWPEFDYLPAPRA
jgi:RimJ/RimL family protein N-acetyltransferase